MKMSVASRPRNASIAAEPVSPDVAPTMVARLPRRARTWVHHPGQELHRHILEGERRAVEQFEEVFLAVSGSS
jgi:hypothetical protein